MDNLPDGVTEEECVHAYDPKRKVAMPSDEKEEM